MFFPRVIKSYQKKSSKTVQNVVQKCAQKMLKKHINALFQHFHRYSLVKLTIYLILSTLHILLYIHCPTFHTRNSIKRLIFEIRTRKFWSITGTFEQGCQSHLWPNLCLNRFVIFCTYFLSGNLLINVSQKSTTLGPFLI